jgi:hypothetical protein
MQLILNRSIELSVVIVQIKLCLLPREYDDLALYVAAAVSSDANKS